MVEEHGVKIGMVCPQFGPHAGGAETIVEGLVGQCLRHGHEVFVIASQRRATLFSSFTVRHQENGAKIYLLPPRNLYGVGEPKKHGKLVRGAWHLVDLWNPFLWFSLVAILSKEKPDFLNCHTLTGISTAVWSASARLRVPVIQTLHDYALICPRGTLLRSNGEVCTDAPLPCRAFRSLNRLLSRVVRGVTGPSEAVMRTVINEGLFPKALARVIPNSCPFPYSPPETPKERPNEKPVFLFLGVLEEHKGLRVLVEAFSRFQAQEAVLRIAGRGSMENFVRQACTGSSSIEYLGLVEGEAKRKALQSADVLVVPSTWPDVYPTVILEAQTFGLPVIASRMGGMTEMVRDGETGLLVEPRNPEQLYGAMASLQRTPDLWTAMHQKVMGMDKCSFQPENYYLSFIDFVNSVLSRPAQSKAG